MINCPGLLLGVAQFEGNDTAVPGAAGENSPAAGFVRAEANCITARL